MHSYSQRWIAPLLQQHRFQVAVCLFVALLKARTSFVDQATFFVLASVMDVIVVFMMYLMHRGNERISKLGLQICIAINSMKIMCMTSNVLHVMVVVVAGMLLTLHSRNILLLLVAFVPAMLVYADAIHCPFAVVYLLESTVGLPLLFTTIPNQFGRRQHASSLASHALAFALLGRLFLARHYLDTGIYRIFEGPWDVPMVFQGKDMFSVTARTCGFLMHVLQVGFFAKFVLQYVPAFCSLSPFRMGAIGCRRQGLNTRARAHAEGASPCDACLDIKPISVKVL